ncbi:hypothetical protein GJ496_011726 [Pomphorhynchus laevis]|nr:hypothetical protein GJ496_011726 [Pomphorhynchus laevis]
MLKFSRLVKLSAQIRYVHKKDTYGSLYIDTHRRSDLVKHTTEIDENSEDVSKVSGIAEDNITSRKCTIFKKAANAMQSGGSNPKWTLEFDTMARWKSGLMGWGASCDPLSNSEIQFAIKDDAIRFCERMKYTYEIIEPNTSIKRNRSYADNFSWNRRTRIHTR